MASTTPKAPSGAGPAGRRLWSSVTAEFDLEEHETALLVEAVRTVDVLAELDELVRSQGAVVE